MFSLRKKSLRLLVLSILMFVLATATYGFAANNTVNGGTIYMGEGEETIAGFTVDVNDFAVSLANPSVVTSVSLDLTPDATADTVYVSVDDGTDWYVCSPNAGANPWTCDLTTGSGESVTAAVFLTVYADGDTYSVTP